MAKYAVIGAGNGGLAFAAVLKNNGHEVRVWNRKDEMLENLLSAKKIQLHGRLDIQATPDVVSDDMAEVVVGAGIVFVVLPAHTHLSVARLMAPVIRPEQLVVLNPGRTGGAVEVRQAFAEFGRDRLPFVAETQTLPFTCRTDAPGKVEIYAVKKQNLLGCLPSWDEMPHRQDLEAFYLCPTFADNCLVTGLGNVGAILHPAPVLLNTGWIETRGTFWPHYYSGISKSIAGFLEKMDEDRMALGRAFGVTLKSVRQWHVDVYGHDGDSLYDVLQQNSDYASIDAPRCLDHRYLWEDLLTGLVPMSELGRLVGVPTKYLDLIIELATAITGFDYRRNGRNVQRLGLEGMTRDQVLRAFGGRPES